MIDFRPPRWCHTSEGRPGVGCSWFELLSWDQSAPLCCWLQGSREALFLFLEQVGKQAPLISLCLLPQHWARALHRVSTEAQKYSARISKAEKNPQEHPIPFPGGIPINPPWHGSQQQARVPHVMRFRGWGREESTLGWEADELMVIIMTIMQNTQIIITENHDYYLWVWDVSSFLELCRSLRCPFSHGSASVTAKLGAV